MRVSCTWNRYYATRAGKFDGEMHQVSQIRLELSNVGIPYMLFVFVSVCALSAVVDVFNYM